MSQSTPLKCSTCGINNVQLYKEEHTNVIFCGKECQKTSYISIDEGVVDIFKNKQAYFKSFNNDKSYYREGSITNTWVAVSDTYENEMKKSKIRRSAKVPVKISYFSEALTDILTTRKDLSAQEKSLYASYVRDAERWIANLKQ